MKLELGMNVSGILNTVLCILMVLAGGGLAMGSCSADVLRDGHRPLSLAISLLGLYIFGVGFMGWRNRRHAALDCSREWMRLLFEHVALGSVLGICGLWLLRGEFFEGTLYVGHQGTSAFSLADIRNVPGLANKLTDLTDDVSNYLHSRFSKETKDLLARRKELRHSDDLDRTAGNAIVDEFNRVIAGSSASLYETSTAHGSSPFDSFLSPRTKALRATKPAGAELLRLNRMLIEDAFANEIHKNYDMRKVWLYLISCCLASALLGFILRVFSARPLNMESGGARLLSVLRARSTWMLFVSITALFALYNSPREVIVSRNRIAIVTRGMPFLWKQELQIDQPTGKSPAQPDITLPNGISVQWGNFEKASGLNFALLIPWHLPQLFDMILSDGQSIHFKRGLAGVGSGNTQEPRTDVGLSALTLSNGIGMRYAKSVESGLGIVTIKMPALGTNRFELVFPGKARLALGADSIVLNQPQCAPLFIDKGMSIACFPEGEVKTTQLKGLLLDAACALAAALHLGLCARRLRARGAGPFV